MGTKRGQALVEMAVGMLALAIVASALCGFALYIARSLEIQNSLRTDGKSNSQSDSVEIGDFAAQHFAGTGVLGIREKVVMPERTILR